MTRCLFVSDLHGSTDRYRKLFDVILQDQPEAVFLGGDLLPSGTAIHYASDPLHEDFINRYLVTELKRIREQLEGKYPRILAIMGNDDGKFEEASMISAATEGVWEYIHNRRVVVKDWCVYGYTYVPPTPFLLKDWERFDVSRYVGPGCVSPEEGFRSVPSSKSEIRYSTIRKDLEQLVGDNLPEKSVFLFHSPPYKTQLDRAALDGKMIDYVPLDVHVGSIAIRRFIEEKQPLLTLHGHVHESTRLTDSWKDRIGRTLCLNAAHDGPELSLIRFDLEKLDGAARELL